MTEVNRTLAHARKLGTLSREEERSVTHGDFWVPEAERELYKVGLAALNAAGIPYVVAGAYAIYEHTGIYRETKDLDIFVEPTHLVSSMRALKSAGLKARLEQPHWLAKATCGDLFIDLIFGMGNGLAMIDNDWYQHSRPAILAATPVRVAPSEELLWHRLFISERHRQDMADIVHLIVCVGRSMDWKRLVAKTAENWPLLLAQIQMFDYVYPEHRDGVPRWVREDLLARARVEMDRERTGERVTRGPLISRFSFTIDVHEWEMHDLRSESVNRTLALPLVREIAESDVWDERSTQVEEFLA
ncbi:MAG TPA: hypothetical protein VK511_00780 [Gemmatimonadaceae bacterium]|nr:hypothetical protein [Gemmatimonadaceae bacterium]